MLEVKPEIQANLYEKADPAYTARHIVPYMVLVIPFRKTLMSNRKLAIYFLRTEQFKLVTGTNLNCSQYVHRWSQGLVFYYPFSVIE
ncbi:hypothetical protein [Desulfosporosinus sp. OT]|uniref:hypothetical protein n=1 Tax=Desulfosporosinus sp. OT TaxID=913865 RepID=UPI0002239F9D|nr:hypothetical protein [Desulfosporosinus sp. OT]EGW40021.1 hypothetical protein DOT_2021 [Desulfosporosinus sp. OT]